MPNKHICVLVQGSKHGMDKEIWRHFVKENKQGLEEPASFPILLPKRTSETEEQRQRLTAELLKQLGQLLVRVPELRGRKLSLRAWAWGSSLSSQLRRQFKGERFTFNHTVRVDVETDPAIDNPLKLHLELLIGGTGYTFFPPALRQPTYTLAVPQNVRKKS